MENTPDVLIQDLVAESISKKAMALVHTVKSAVWSNSARRTTASTVYPQERLAAIQAQGIVWVLMFVATLGSVKVRTTTIAWMTSLVARRWTAYVLTAKDAATIHFVWTHRDNSV